MNTEADPTQPIGAQLQQLQMQMQAEIANLQQQLVAANQAYNNITTTTNHSSMRAGKPEKFNGKNARSWLKSIRTVFETQNIPPNEEQKIKYAVSYMSGDGLHWWELVLLNKVELDSFDIFEKEMLKHFEPVNRELTARKVLSDLKQMGKFNTVRAYNREFSRWLLQIPTMDPAERIFHYSNGLKTKMRIEVGRAEPDTLDKAMRIADKMDSLYYSNGRYMGQNNGNGVGGPTPMQIGNIQRRRFNNNFDRRNQLSFAERKRRMEHNLCYICGKANCIARNHYNDGNGQGFNRQKQPGNRRFNQNRSGDQAKN